MRWLIVCCDGTWNTPDQEEQGLPSPTNVVRFKNVLKSRDDQGNEQRTYYHSGVGTEGTWWQRLLGGAVGSGLSRNIRSAYHWLARNFTPGDRIALIGFSRGAFTVRSLSGFIHACGLLDLSGLPFDEGHMRVKRAYLQGYRLHQTQWNEHQWPRFLAGAVPDIHFLGVWDTVGALGIPDNFALLNLFDNPKTWQFHSLELGEHVQCARHALAADEMRASFTPTRWSPAKDRIQDAQEMWFAGVHGDVGGGYLTCGLSDLALHWMIEEARKQGLAFDEDMLRQIRPDSQAPMHNPLNGLFGRLRTRPRATPPIGAQAHRTDVHPSLADRQQRPPISMAPYRPLSVVGSQPHHATIWACAHWNPTGLYLEPGTYRCTVSGQWQGRSIPCGPEGLRHLGPLVLCQVKSLRNMIGAAVYLVGSVLGRLELGFRWLAGNWQADFWGTRRFERWPWMSLIGIVANDDSLADDAACEPGNDGSPQHHQAVFIGTGTEFKVRTGGYFYAFANEAWARYPRNHGSVTLTIQRV